MTFDEYQERAANTAIYPRDKALEYVVLGLCSEAGELAGKLKKVIRDKGGAIGPQDAAGLCSEAGDIGWYLSQLFTEIGFSFGDGMRANLHKLADRGERGVLGGSGDNR